MNIDMLRQKSCIFVGEVNDSHQFKQGTMVTALKKVPIDTRFISIPSDFLISLPERLDPGEASACEFTLTIYFRIAWISDTLYSALVVLACFWGTSSWV